MTSIDDIPFDPTHIVLSRGFLLLADAHPNVGPFPHIAVRDAPLMVFIKVFRNLFQCQAFVSTDNRKMIKLVISDGQLMNWNDQIQAVDNNIEDIHIFAQSYFDYLRMKRWNGLYANRRRSVFEADKLNYKLTMLGIDYLHTLMEEYRSDRSLRERMRQDVLRLNAALTAYFEQAYLDEEPMADQAQ